MKIANTIISSLFIMATAIVIGAVVCLVYGVIAEGPINFISWLKDGMPAREVVEQVEAAAKVWVGSVQI